MDKKAQMKLSFGMIFSIILIIFFLAFAFYAIYQFLGVKTSAEIGQFVNDLNGEVDQMWKATQGSQEIEYSLPSKIEEVCFNDNSEIYFLPLGAGESFDYSSIPHLNVEVMNVGGDLCIPKQSGKIKLKVKKEYSENLVTISQ